MIQNIHPHLFSNKYTVSENIKGNDYIFHFKENSLLLKRKGDEVEIPQRKDLTGLESKGISLFTLNNSNCYLVRDCPLPDKNLFYYHEIKSSRTILQKEIDWTSLLALQLKNWYEQNKFCGNCGNPTEPKKNERAIICPACNKILYPSISPAIIVAILSNNKVLLARGANFPKGFFSLVAGYVDIGESIEDAVKREVMEEVGLEIKNIRYYGSQPWPYSGSMMIGFIADGDENQPVKIDNKEIVEAGWYSSDNLPNHPPDRSIAGEIIEKFIKKEL